MELTEKITLDMLTQDSVSVLRQQFFKRQRNRNAGRRKCQKRIRKQHKRQKKPQRSIAR